MPEPSDEAILNDWLVFLPHWKKLDLESRLRSRDNRHRLGAILELYCHAILRLQGFSIEVRKDSPDYVGSIGGSTTLAIECTMAASSDTETANHTRINEFCRALNSNLESHGFFIILRVIRYPSGSPSAAKACQFLEERLRNLDPNGDSGSAWTWEDANGEFVFSPITKPRANQKKPGTRPIGMVSYPAKWVDLNAIRKTIRSKTGAHGNLELPFIIAISITRDNIDVEDMAEVLFGRRALRHDGSRIHIRPQDGRSGFWNDDAGRPDNQGVSAILLISELYPWPARKAQATLWHNPWARRPLDIQKWNGTQILFNEHSELLERREGLMASDILGLPR